MELLQQWLKAASDSGFLKLDAVDWKHLGVEALLAGGLAAVGVFGAKLTGVDIGYVTPLVAWGLTMLTSALKKALTDNEKK